MTGPLARLSRRPWLVTGANGLLTSAIAHRLAGVGVPMLLHVHGRTDRIDSLLHGSNPAVFADLENAGDRDLLVSQAIRLAPLGGLVLGASRFQMTPPDDTSGLTGTLSLDLLAPVELALRLAPHMAPGGRIILFGDAGTTLGWPSYTAYLAAKGGVEAALPSLARRLGPRVVVLGVAPGAVEGAPSPPEGTLRHRTALGRPASPEEVARAILRFAALPSPVSHGRILVVDGGRRLYPAESVVAAGPGGS